MKIRYFDKRGVEEALHWLREEMRNEIAGRDPKHPTGSDRLEYAFNDLAASAGDLTDKGGGAPSAVSWKTDLDVYQFENTAPAEYLDIGLQLPHSYVQGSDLHFHVHFVPTTAISDGETVIFELTYTIASIGDVFPATETVTCTFKNDASRRRSLNHAAVSGTDIVADTHLIAGGGKIPGDGINLSAILQGKFTRDQADTFAGDVNVLSLDTHIQLDRIGSREEYKG